MCAIAGILDLCINDEMIADILNSMARRGPDGNGFVRDRNWVLLHSRLAIIDPQGGRQPMELSWAGERYFIVYNGELYNTQELRQELVRLGHSFISHSDTEVLLHGFAQWGEGPGKTEWNICLCCVPEKRRQVIFGQRPDRREAAFLCAAGGWIRFWF